MMGSTLLDGSASFDPDGSISTYEWDLNGDGNFDDATGVAPNFDATNLDGPGSVVVSLRVTDNNGTASTATSLVTIINFPPAVDATGYGVKVGETATIGVTFTDPASADTHTATIDWGDGSAIEDLGAVTSPFNPTHAYAFGGIYTVILTVTDDDGGEGIAEAEVTVEEGDVGATTLKVIKHVINNGGGIAVASDWQINVTATNPDPAAFPGAEVGATIGLDAGEFSISESSGPSGYTISMLEGCSGIITVGDHKTCTITNDDVAPSLVEGRMTGGGRLINPERTTTAFS